jgi:hypothetical protein
MTDLTALRRQLLAGNIPPAPANAPATRLTAAEIIWIQAHLHPGEDLAAFLPPPYRQPGTIKRAKRWPIWLELAAGAALLAVLPLAASSAFVVVVVGLPLVGLWRLLTGTHKPRRKAPRPIPELYPRTGRPAEHLSDTASRKFAP